MKIIPLNKQVLVIPNDPVSRTRKSGLQTPDDEDQERKAIGIVEAVGPEVTNVKKGDRVIYGAYAGESLSLEETKNEDDYILLFNEDVLAILED